MHEIAVLHNWESCEVAAFLNGKPASLLNTNRRHPRRTVDTQASSQILRVLRPTLTQISDIDHRQKDSLCSSGSEPLAAEL